MCGGIALKTTHTSHNTGSDDGLWTHLDGNTVYIIELSFWEELDSSAVETYGKYNVQAGSVEIPVFEAPFARSDSDSQAVRDMHSALRSSGFALDPQTGDVVNEYDGAIVCPRGTLRTSSKGRKERRRWLLCIAECMWRYGAKDVAYDGSGNNRKKLVREAHHAL
jgi:hypothetical protein